MSKNMLRVFYRWPVMTDFMRKVDVEPQGRLHPAFRKHDLGRTSLSTTEPDRTETIMRKLSLTGPARSSESLKALVASRRGAAALEFALIAPLLLSLYFVTMEVSQAVETTRSLADRQHGRRPGNAAPGNDGDRDPRHHGYRLATLQPYKRTLPEITVTQTISTRLRRRRPTIEWFAAECATAPSWPARRRTRPHTTVPEKLRIADNYLIRVETKLNYRPVITWARGPEGDGRPDRSLRHISMGGFYLRPRE